MTYDLHGAVDGSIPVSAGIGLRFQHHQAVLDERPDIAWFEAHTENYMGRGTPLRYLEAVRCDYPVALHGVGLSIGSADELDATHLQRIRNVVERIDPGAVSEHLSWSFAAGDYLGDLLPLPLTEEALGVVCRHVDCAQDHLGRRILVENPSSYLRYAHSTIPEWEFVSAVATRTGCGILCDINNIYVSAGNHRFDASRYLRALPAAHVLEFHLAGHVVRELPGGITLRVDDHGSRVSPAVWALYDEALTCIGPRPTLIEWDTDVPPLDVLLDEARTASRMMDGYFAETAIADAA